MDFLQNRGGMALICFLCGVNLLLIQFTDLDLFVQDKVYDFQTHKWLLQDVHAKYGWLLYKGIKVVLKYVGISLLILLALSFTQKFANLRAYRRALLCVVLSMIICPAMVAGGKQITNVYCPYQIERYGGKYPYVKPFSNYPAGFVQERRGEGFPAAHAAGGFSLISLFFLFKERKRRIIWGGCGILMGIFMGTYQILRGQHYVGDTLLTALGCLLVNLLIFGLVSGTIRSRPDKGPVPWKY